MLAPQQGGGIRGLSSMVEQVEVAAEEGCYVQQLFDRRNFVQDNVNRGEIQDDGYQIPDTRYRIWVDCVAIGLSACTFVNKIVLRCKQSSWYAFFEDTEYSAAASAHGCINGAPPV